MLTPTDKKYSTILAAVFAILVLGGMVFFRPTKDQNPVARVPSTSCTLFLRGEIQIAIADTPQLQEKGLSGHAPLAPDEGMLFVFDSSGRRGFWMKDMAFAIDIVWLDSELRVLSTLENLSPDSYPTSYQSSEDMRYVLEVPAGTVFSRGIVPGDSALIDSDCKS
jgi:uncharacterized membrane protein (UPF0127 family)